MVAGGGGSSVGDTSSSAESSTGERVMCAMAPRLNKDLSMERRFALFVFGECATNDPSPRLRACAMAGILGVLTIGLLALYGILIFLYASFFAKK